MAARGKRHRGWGVTLNNPTEEEREWIADLVVTDDRFRYVIGQYEVGRQGTEHWQGYLQFRGEKTHGQATEAFPRAWIEARRGTHDKAKHYASKPHEACNCEHCTEARGMPNNGWADERELTEQGEAIVERQRTDIEDVMNRIREGASDREIAEEFPGSWVRNHRAYERYRAIVSPIERSWVTHTTVFTGPPGTGKTHRAHALAGPGAYWVTYGTNVGAPQYFDGYDGQECVVFDEFTGQVRREAMCKLLDKFPCNVPVRGGQQPWLPKRVIITSNQTPEEWWPRMGLGPIERRLAGDYGTVIAMHDVYVGDSAAGVGAERSSSSTEPYGLAEAIGANAQRRGEWRPAGQYMT